MEIQGLEHGFGMPCEFLESGKGLVGVDNLNKLDLVELMDADNPSCVSSCTSRFPSPAGSVRSHFNWEVLFLKQGAAVEVGNRNLCGRNQKELTVLSGIDLLGKFRQLTGSDSALSSGQVGHSDLLVSVGLGLEIEKILDECPLQARSFTAEHRKSAPQSSPVLKGDELVMLCEGT